MRLKEPPAGPDDVDFMALLPLLSKEQRAWLKEAVSRVYVGEHPWVVRCSLLSWARWRTNEMDRHSTGLRGNAYDSLRAIDRRKLIRSSRPLTLRSRRLGLANPAPKASTGHGRLYRRAHEGRQFY